MTLKLSKFNEKGLKEFENFLDSARDSGVASENEVSQLLNDASFVEVIDDNIDVSEIILNTRLEAGEHLLKLLDINSSHIQDPKLWAWLTLRYFDSVCSNTNGNYVILDRSRYIYDPENFRTYYRHLLFGPFSIYLAHRDDPDRVRAVLCTPVHSPGDVVEQLASRQDLITCDAVMEVATKLYFDPETKKHKLGASSKDGGSARRFADVMMQLDLTYDLPRIKTEQLLELLPPEFDKFKS